jgi:alkylation response protein AidB-like acyl-CoA dehydrogenase
MLVRVEMMRATVRYAAKFSEPSVAGLEAASVAKAYSSQAAVAVTEALIQILGGMGFTWEHPAHLYLRRARALQSSFGNAAFHRQHIADLRSAKAVI